MSNRYTIVKTIAIRALELGYGIDKTYELLRGFVGRTMIAQWNQDAGGKARKHKAQPSRNEAA